LHPLSTGAIKLLSFEEITLHAAYANAQYAVIEDSFPLKGEVKL
jgi:hypothetical protein